MPDDRKPHLTGQIDPVAVRPTRANARPRPRREEAPDEDERFPARSTANPEQTRRLALDIARNLADDRCEHVVVLDVRELSQVAEYVVIASGTSQRQMASALDHVVTQGKEQGHPSWRTSHDDRTTWLLADFVDVVVHLFEPNTRAHYDLEMLWGDADRVDWRSELGLPRGYPLHGEIAGDEPADDEEPEGDDDGER